MRLSLWLDFSYIELVSMSCFKIWASVLRVFKKRCKYELQGLSSFLNASRPVRELPVYTLHLSIKQKYFSMKWSWVLFLKTYLDCTKNLISYQVTLCLLSGISWENGHWGTLPAYITPNLRPSLNICTYLFVVNCTFCNSEECGLLRPTAWITILPLPSVCLGILVKFKAILSLHFSSVKWR